jgi:pimeloyl-ACP methyl ester carboxylesterase
MKQRRELILAVVIVLLSELAFTQALTSATIPKPPGKMVDIGGRKLHMHCAGKTGPVVILENGASSFSVDWALVQSRVGEFARVCSYDRAGFAWSEPGPAINTVEQTMDDLHQLLRVESIRPPYVLVGASIGGMFVRAYQRRYPEEVVGLVLVDATPEEDLMYMVDGKDTPGVRMRYDQMQSVYAPYIKNPPAPRELPTEVGEPYDRLPKDLQAARLWAQRQFLAQIDMPHSWITAESWREEFVALLRLRRENTFVLGDLPLIVLARGRRSDETLSKREAELATMSRSGKEVIAKDSDHEIFLYQPELVTQAIRDVLKQARAGKRLREGQVRAY